MGSLPSAAFSPRGTGFSPVPFFYAHAECACSGRLAYVVLAVRGSLTPHIFMTRRVSQARRRYQVGPATNGDRYAVIRSAGSETTAERGVSDPDRSQNVIERNNFQMLPTKLPMPAVPPNA
jgi:hypothetical protein